MDEIGEHKKLYLSATDNRLWNKRSVGFMWLIGSFSMYLSYQGMLAGGISQTTAMILTFSVFLAQGFAWTLTLTYFPRADRGQKKSFGILGVFVLVVVLFISSYFSFLGIASERAQQASTQALIERSSKDSMTLRKARDGEKLLQQYFEAQALRYESMAESERKDGLYSGTRGKSQIYAALLQLADAYRRSSELLDVHSAKMDEAYLSTHSNLKKLQQLHANMKAEGGEFRTSIEQDYERTLLLLNDSMRSLNTSVVPSALMMVEGGHADVIAMPINSKRAVLQTKLESAKEAIVAVLHKSENRTSSLLDELDRRDYQIAIYTYENALSAILSQFDKVVMFLIGSAALDLLVPAMGLFACTFLAGLEIRRSEVVVRKGSNPNPKKGSRYVQISSIENAQAASALKEKYGSA